MPSRSLPRSAKITLTGFALLLATFLSLAVLPYWRESRSLQSDIRTAQDTIARSAQQSARLREITRRGQLLRLDVKNYDRLVPDNQDLGTFLGQLSSELDAAGMHDTAVRALPPTPLGKCQQLPIEIRGAGSYAQFRDFLIHLENLPRMSSVSHLNIEADNNMSDNLTVALTLAIYNTTSKPR